MVLANSSECRGWLNGRELVSHEGSDLGNRRCRIWSLLLRFLGKQPAGASGVDSVRHCVSGRWGRTELLRANHLKARNRVGDVALAMLHEDSKIDCAALAQRLQMRETKVRELIADLQRHPFQSRRCLNAASPLEAEERISTAETKLAVRRDFRPINNSVSRRSALCG